jgi:hypothetical protein
MDPAVAALDIAKAGVILTHRACVACLTDCTGLSDVASTLV